VLWLQTKALHPLVPLIGSIISLNAQVKSEIFNSQKASSVIINQLEKGNYKLIFTREIDGPPEYSFWESIEIKNIKLITETYVKTEEVPDVITEDITVIATWVAGN
jgi:hypothetical protein